MKNYKNCRIYLYDGEIGSCYIECAYLRGVWACSVQTLGRNVILCLYIQCCMQHNFMSLLAACSMCHWLHVDGSFTSQHASVLLWASGLVHLFFFQVKNMSDVFFTSNILFSDNPVCKLHCFFSITNDLDCQWEKSLFYWTYCMGVGVHFWLVCMIWY